MRNDEGNEQGWSATFHKSQTLAAVPPAKADHLPPGACTHSFAKSACLRAFSLAWLIGAFDHDVKASFFEKSLPEMIPDTGLVNQQDPESLLKKSHRPDRMVGHV